MTQQIRLFADYNLSDVLRRAELQMNSEIDQIEPNALLNTSVEDLCDQLEEKYVVEAPLLHEDGITVDDEEARINHAHGITIKFFVPFSGETHLLKCQASTFLSNPPRVKIGEGELVLSYTRTDHDADAARATFHRDLENIKRCLTWTVRDVAPFNKSLRSRARERIEARRCKLLKDRGMVGALGYPMRRRADPTQTYIVPTVRRKPAIAKAAASEKPFKPEPALDMGEYEHILSVISNMVHVIERSPHAFKGMKEEDLRQHFLVQLNGQYEGQATGETFNLEGKTDILIRAEGKNIFIAECKFWRGPKSVGEAIDPLLSYTSWRDTKTALLIFNRQKDFSQVLAKGPGLVKAHPNCKRQLEYKSETGFRFVLHHRDDKDRELILAVLVFEVPA